MENENKSVVTTEPSELKNDHKSILEKLDDLSVKKRFKLESITNLEIFKQNPRLLIRLKMCLEQNNYYEAHQAYKTLHFRCMNSNLFDDGLELIFNGICFFMENNQTQCGVDLAKTFFETLKKSSKKSLNRPLIDQISYIHELLKNNSEERTDFAANVLKWSSALNNLNSKQRYIGFGHPDIHREFAINLWKEKNYPQSRYHFIHSNDGELCAHMLVEYHLNYGYPSEIDLFITQTVLQILCLNNKQTANVVFKHYIEIHPNIEETKPSFKLPLLNYLWFLLISIDEGLVSAFKALREAYKPSLSVDLSYNDYLEKIGQIYFNIKSKRNQQQNPLNNLLRMFISNDQNADNQNNSEEYESAESNCESDTACNIDEDNALD